MRKHLAFHQAEFRREFGVNIHFVQGSSLGMAAVHNRADYRRGLVNGMVRKVIGIGVGPVLISWQIAAISSMKVAMQKFAPRRGPSRP